MISREEYKIYINNYINKLNEKKIALQLDALKEINTYKGDADNFFGMLRRLYYEYDCIKVAINENKSLCN